jgi:hypothetical protein
MNISNKVVISLGKKNAVHLREINDELKLFKEVIELEHPRYIMQYKRKHQNQYVMQYFDVLKNTVTPIS